jgi:hypothetical protein
MSPSQAWLIYILVVIVAYILLTIITYTARLSTLVRLFLSFLIGALLIFILSPSIITKSEADRTWYGLLVLVAFVVPLVLGIWLIFAYRNRGANLLQQKECVVERTIRCDANGSCHVAGETRHCPAEPTPNQNFDGVSTAPAASASPRRRVTRRRSSRGGDNY